MTFVNLSNERIGTINKNNQGSIMIVEQYNRTDDIWVRFIEYGNLVNTDWRNFCEGSVKNVYDKMVLGVGFFGEGEYLSRINGKTTPQYSKWYSMLNRCYNEKFYEKYSCYEGCSVSEEWHNFQNFAKWYDENYYEIEGQKMHLDKDILVKGNKIYSPETCIFVPNRINILFVKGHENRGSLPMGVALNRSSKKPSFEARCKNNGHVIIGYYNSPEKAFQAYKEYKENIINEVAEEFRNRIPEKLYYAMLAYEVNIND